MFLDWHTVKTLLCFILIAIFRIPRMCNAVLSACNTGGGKITGDGIIGLSRAIGAGAASIIFSL